MKKLHIQLLRGTYLPENAKPLAEALHGVDLILFELYASKASADRLAAACNGLSQKSDYTETFAKHMAAQKDDLPLILQTAWELRHQGKIFGFIGEQYDKDSTAVADDTIGFYMQIEKEMHEVLTMEKNENYYDSIDQRFATFAEKITGQDAEMVRQVTNLIRSFLDSPEDGPFKSQDILTVACVNGDLHRLAPGLRQQFPELNIEERTFNDSHLQQVMKYPTILLLLQKLEHPDVRIPFKLIDYFIYVSLLARSASADDKSTERLTFNSADAAFTTPNAKKVLQTALQAMQQAGSIDDYTDDELLHIVSKEIVKVRLGIN